MPMFTKEQYETFLCEIDKNEKNVNENVAFGAHLLFHAIRDGQYELALQFIERGADVNRTDNNFVSTLSMAIACKNCDLARKLIAKGADINLVSADGYCALVTMINFGMKTFLDEMLTIGGLDLNAQNEETGNTAMHYCAKHGRADVIRQLIGMGVEVHVLNKNKKTPLQIAADTNCNCNCKMKTEDCANNIDDVYVTNNHARVTIVHAIANENYDLVRNLLKKGADINLVRVDGYCALVTMLDFRTDSFFNEMLTIGGLDLNAQNEKTGNTAMHYYANHGCDEKIRQLIAMGADMHVLNKNNETPLEIIVRTSCNLKMKRMKMAEGEKEQEVVSSEKQGKETEDYATKFGDLKIDDVSGETPAEIHE